MIIKITEEQYKFFANARDVLAEDVYADNIDANSKTINLTYNKGGSSRKRNKYNGEFLKTDKMDASGYDTYIVPLKGGIMSYNITSISGTEVMHYFKNYFEIGDRKGASIKIDNEDYNLSMKEQEFRDFMKQFTDKVGAVVNHYVNEIKSQNGDIDFKTLSIYPVRSSSNFNVEMVNQLLRLGLTINGMNIRTVNKDILNKDVSQLEKDEEFIEKNSEYYNSRRSPGYKVKGTHLQALNTAMNMLEKTPEIEEQIKLANEYTTAMRSTKRGKLLKQWDYVKMRFNQGKLTQNSVDLLYQYFIEYQNIVDNIMRVAQYYDECEQKYMNRYMKSIANVIKNTKGPSVLKRKTEIYDFLQQHGYRGKLPKRQDVHDICTWEPIKFQIKKLNNDCRMGLRNMFKFDDDVLQQEIDEIKNTILVVFDDNISGGATLSDICYQYKKLGIEHIIPITFGKMKESWSVGNLGVLKPKNGFNY